MKYLFLFSFNQKLNVSKHYSKTPSTQFSNIITVEGEGADRRTEMTDLIFACRNSLAEARKKSVFFATYRQDSQPGLIDLTEFCRNPLATLRRWCLCTSVQSAASQNSKLHA